ncbi:MAG TPA: VanW family protein [Bacillota bacterium]|jgi:vancomycin resistance protein YoaR|nr:vancomycin resistance protein [Bacillota bacterium]HOA34941.1 VanW family protein [Bacillota bacterium]HOJ84979.1 VanW family protein [Bacillota bacterium]HOL14687.1 VanW family protein [Bacillota bacterium]HPZ11098.1 VanW family protein [Bacillota bacterium]
MRRISRFLWWGPGCKLTLILCCIGLAWLAAAGCSLFPPGGRVSRGVELEGKPAGGLSRREVAALVDEIAAEIDQPPRNAFIDPHSGEIVAEVIGRQIDRLSTVKKVMSAPAGGKVLAEVIQLDPEITTAHFAAINREIGAFRTWIGGGGGRATNIILATQSLNNYLLLPGEVFSFNAANGPRTAERGYRPAPIIVGNTVVPGLGGGVCQVSTTLYNAVLRAGLEVVERYPHSQPVGYVPPGMDATVADTLDFKFRNSTDRLIMIRSSNWGGSIDIRIWQE